MFADSLEQIGDGQWFPNLSENLLLQKLLNITTSHRIPDMIFVSLSRIHHFFTYSPSSVLVRRPIILQDAQSNHSSGLFKKIFGK